MTFPGFKNFPRYRPPRNLLYYGIILLTSVVVYSGGFGNDFLVNWDDPTFVTANPDIQSITLANLRRIFTSLYAGGYAPVQMLSYMLDHSLWGPNCLAFLLVNVVLHSLNALLLYRLLYRLHFPSEWALLAALLFTVHPVQVESVAWISQRKSVLAMTFFLAAFWQYLTYAEQEERDRRHYALALGFFFLALLTKSVTVILPAILLSYDIFLRGHRGSLLTIAFEKLPFALLALGGAWLAMLDDGNRNPSGELLGGSAFSAAMTMLTVYKEYLFNLFWPLQLSAQYHVNIKSAIDAEVFFSAALLAVSLASVMLAGRAMRRIAVFWLAVFFIGFLPVSQIVPLIHIMNDRYLYFPMLGFAAGLAVFLHCGVAKFPALAKPALLGTTFILLIFAGLAWQRAGVWASSQSLWQDAVRKQPESAKAWSKLGNAHDKSGNIRDAITNYQKSLALDPADYETNYNLGTLFYKIGEFDSALQYLGKSVDLKPDYIMALYNLGYTHMLTGQYEAAVKAFTRALQLKPGNPELLMLLGANYYCIGDLSAAWQTYEKVRHLDSEFSAMAAGLEALIALREEKRTVSSRFWQESMARGFSTAEIYLNWARLEAIGNRKQEALGFLAKALSHGARDLLFLYQDPTFGSLHNDAEFKRMIQP